MLLAQVVVVGCVLGIQHQKLRDIYVLASHLTDLRIASNGLRLSMLLADYLKLRRTHGLGRMVGLSELLCLKPELLCQA